MNQKKKKDETINELKKIEDDNIEKEKRKNEEQKQKKLQEIENFLDVNTPEDNSIHDVLDNILNIYSGQSKSFNEKKNNISEEVKNIPQNQSQTLINSPRSRKEKMTENVEEKTLPQTKLPQPETQTQNNRPQSPQESRLRPRQLLVNTPKKDENNDNMHTDIKDLIKEILKLTQSIKSNLSKISVGQYNNEDFLETFSQSVENSKKLNGMLSEFKKIESSARVGLFNSIIETLSEAKKVSRNETNITQFESKLQIMIGNVKSLISTLDRL